MRNETLQRVVNRSSWRYPAIPKRGRILGGFTSILKAPPDKFHYDLVEFRSPGGGKLLACGLPIFDFDLRTDHRGGKYQGYRNMVRLMQNAAAYLAKETAPAKVAPGLDGPLCVVDLARKSANPALSWRVSSGKGAAALFGDERGLFVRWETRKMPAWVEIDLGREAVIDKVAVWTCWSSSGYADIGRGALKVADAATGAFVDVSPPARVQGRGYLGVTFRFKPVRTRKVRLEGLYGDEAEGKVPAGINSLMIYGTAKP